MARIIRPIGMSPSIKLYMRFNGANLSTTFRDEASGHKGSIAATNDAYISTSQSKFGGSSLYCAGTEDYVTIPYSSDFDFAGDFFIGFWLRLDTSQPGTPARGIFSHNTYAATGVALMDTGSSNLVLYSDGDIRITATLPTAETWTYVSVLRDGTSVKIYINGSQSGSTYTKSGTFSCHASGIILMARHSPYQARSEAGYIDDLVIVNGIALDGTIIPKRQLI